MIHIYYKYGKLDIVVQSDKLTFIRSELVHCLRYENESVVIITQRLIKVQWMSLPENYSPWQQLLELIGLNVRAALISAVILLTGWCSRYLPQIRQWQCICVNVKFNMITMVWVIAIIPAESVWIMQSILLGMSFQKISHVFIWRRKIFYCSAFDIKYWILLCSVL